MELDITDYVLLALVVFFMFGSGYGTGKWHERRTWHKNLPGAMEMLCVECEDVGIQKARGEQR